jgi:transposase InsO family protein
VLDVDATVVIAHSEKEASPTFKRTFGKRGGDLLNRDFTAEAPNRVWVTDFT